MATPAHLRKRLLHILLWCLAASAASGVLTVLVSDRDILWRVTAMGFVSAAAVGLMIPLSLLVDRDRFRTAGLFGMSACIAAFVLASALIWAGRAGLGGWQLEERIGLSLLLDIFMGPAIVLLLCLRAANAGRTAGLVGLCSAAAATALFAIEIWHDDLISYTFRFGETGGAVCWCGLIATLSLIGLGTDSRYWRWLGIVGAAAGLVMSIYGIWFVPSSDSSLLVTVLSISAVVAFANVLLRAPLRGGQMLVVYGTIAAAAAVAAFLILDIYVQERDYQDPFGFKRFMAGASIMTVSGALAVVVLTLLNRRAMRKAAYAARAVGSDGAPGAALTHISISCPRCQREQTLPLGEASCSACRLIIHTRVEVPVCRNCGYDISTIRGDNCPECGSLLGTPRERDGGGKYGRQDSNLQPPDP
jgi:hypothetical protein